MDQIADTNTIRPAIATMTGRTRLNSKVLFLSMLNLTCDDECDYGAS